MLEDAAHPWLYIRASIALPHEGPRHPVGLHVGERSASEADLREWAVPGSNGRPPACKAGALPTELTAPAGESSIRLGECPALLESAGGAGHRGGYPVRHPRPRASGRLLRGLGLAVGPVIWLACSLVTARILDIPRAYVLFSAVAAEWPALIVMLVTTHWAGMIAAPAGLRRLLRQLRPAARGRGSRERATK